MNAEAKTLDDPQTLRERAANAREENTETARVDAGIFIRYADFLDRLSAPVEGVGLTRYNTVSLDDGRDVMDPHPYGEWVRHDDATAALTAKEAERAEAEERIEVLELDAGRISAEFEGDLWKAIRHVVESNPGFTWGDYEPEGMTADDVATLFSEDMAAAWADVERFKARAEKAEAERDALKAALDETDDLVAGYIEAVDPEEDREAYGRSTQRFCARVLAERAALSPAQGGE